MLLMNFIPFKLHMSISCVYALYWARCQWYEIDKEINNDFNWIKYNNRNNFPIRDYYQLNFFYLHFKIVYSNVYLLEYRCRNVTSHFVPIKKDDNWAWGPFHFIGSAWHSEFECEKLWKMLCVILKYDFSKNEIHSIHHLALGWVLLFHTIHLLQIQCALPW